MKFFIAMLCFRYDATTADQTLEGRAQSSKDTGHHNGSVSPMLASFLHLVRPRDIIILMKFVIMLPVVIEKLTKMLQSLAKNNISDPSKLMESYCLLLPAVL